MVIWVNSPSFAKKGKEEVLYGNLFQQLRFKSRAMKTFPVCSLDRTNVGQYPFFFSPEYFCRVCFFMYWISTPGCLKAACNK